MRYNLRYPELGIQSHQTIKQWVRESTHKHIPTMAQSDRNKKPPS